MDEWMVRQEIEQIFRRERPGVLATLIRLIGDFDVAEDSMQAAWVTALERWPTEGVPRKPGPWLISTARFKAIDTLRRKARIAAILHDQAMLSQVPGDPLESFDESGVEDDRLRLIFICCHPALSREAQAALTLREVCGLTTEEIARAYLSSPTTIAQRIVRAKAKIREEQIPYEIPDASELPGRMTSVLTVAYLLYNEGYYASAGETLTRQLLSREAIRLARLLVELLPDPEVFGLLALMLLQEARSAARTTKEGDVILFADQDPALWDRKLLSEGLSAVTRALDVQTPGEYALQAAIAALHVQGALTGAEEWEQVLNLYDLLLSRKPSAIVQLNRAVAVTMVNGPEAGLRIVDGLLDEGGLDGYGMAHSTRADFCRRLGRVDEAVAAYARALALTNQGAERRFLEQRLRELSGLVKKT